MTATVSRTNRSRVTNGHPFPAGVDGRSATARRWKDLHAEYSAALPGAPTAATGALLRTLASVALALEQIAAQQADNATVDSERLVALANLQGRLLERLGLTPAAEPPKPDPLTEYRKRMGWDPR